MSLCSLLMYQEASGLLFILSGPIPVTNNCALYAGGPRIIFTKALPRNFMLASTGAPILQNNGYNFCQRIGEPCNISLKQAESSGELRVLRHGGMGGRQSLIGKKFNWDRILTWFNSVKKFYGLNICNTNFLKYIDVKLKWRLPECTPWFSAAHSLILLLDYLTNELG